MPASSQRERRRLMDVRDTQGAWLLVPQPGKLDLITGGTPGAAHDGASEP